MDNWSRYIRTDDLNNSVIIPVRTAARAIIGAMLSSAAIVMSGSSDDTMVVDGSTRSCAEADAARPRQVLGSTLAAAFANVMSMYSSRPCLGWLSDGAFVWQSYAAFERDSLSVAAPLSARTARNCLVGIIGENCYDWYVADFACLWAGVASVPLSSAWEDSVLEAVLAQTRVGVIFCTHGMLTRLLNAIHLHGSCNVSLVVTFSSKFGTASDASTGAATGAASPIEVMSLDAFRASAPPIHPNSLPRTRAPLAPHTILHTSGTTGVPKGVVYTDRLWLANMARYDGLQVGYSYMPLAFITDRHTVYTTLWNGGRVGIATPSGNDQPSNAQPGKEEHRPGKEERLFSDLLRLRPTVLKGVPQFWEHVHAASRLVQDTSLRLLGGRARVLCCGAGGVSRELADYFRACTSVHGEAVQFLELYGGTECGNLALNRQLLPHVEWRLLPVDGLSPIEAEGIAPHDGAAAAVRRQSGELVVKTGAMMFGGYYGDDARTAAAFTHDCFYRTGDIVTVSATAEVSNGGATSKGGATVYHIEVSGRAQSAIKLANGKWVHPEALEELYRAAAGVVQLLVHGDASHSHLAAVVEVVDATAHSAEGLVAAFGALAVAGGRPAHEYVRAVVVAGAPFSLAAGTLNGTGKLVRPALRRVYGEELSVALDELEVAMSLRGFDEGSSFAEQGGTSVHAARIAQLYLRLGIPIERSMVALLQASSIHEAQTAICRDLVGDSADPEADCHAVPAPPPTSHGPTSPSGARRSGMGLSRCLALWRRLTARRDAVLVTGATGFVGAFMVAELLDRGEARVVCIVRASNDHEAAERIHQALVRTRRWRPAWCTRVHALAGSLTADLLGLSAKTWRQVACSVRAVVHCGAVVDLKRSYAFHRRTNVLGTLEVLRFCREARARLVFLSTTDVLPSSGDAADVCGAAAAANGKELGVPSNQLSNQLSSPGHLTAQLLSHVRAAAAVSGYAASKAVGECIVSAAFGRGEVRGVIARLGMCVGDTRCGLCEPTNFVSRLLLGIAATRAFPDTESRMHTMVHALPVDTVAAACVDIACISWSGGVVDIVSAAPRVPMATLREELLAYGAPFTSLPVVPFAAWMRRVQADAALSLWPVLGWAAHRETFPVFNTRCPSPTLCLQVVRPPTADAIRNGVDEAALHAMLTHLFASSGRLGWHTLRRAIRHRRVSEQWPMNAAGLREKARRAASGGLARLGVAATAAAIFVLIARGRAGRVG